MPRPHQERFASRHGYTTKQIQEYARAAIAERDNPATLELASVIFPAPHKGSAVEDVANRKRTK
jgi:hypothetical protein